jgi:large subunit ribosomal protein L2
MKFYKPTTPSRRKMTGTDFSVLTKKKPEKKLLKSLKRKAGRSSNGRITVRHKGGGAKRLYRIIDFGEEKINMPAQVIALEYDPFRSAFIALLEYQDKEKRYILSPQGLKIGDEVMISEKAPVSPANRMKLKNIATGAIVYNVEIEPGRGGKFIKSAGSSAQVLAQEERYTHLKMPSGEERKILSECFASIGEVSNPEHRFIRLGKAGRSRWKGIRPTVRGSVMNPVDHPHGGGEGRCPIGLPYPKTPWGRHALGVKTRKKKWTDKLIIQRRRKKRK